MKLKKKLLKKKNKYLLACSFGPDSMALLSLLLNNDYDFDVAIVNYHLRKESDDEVNGLKSFLKDKNINLFIKEVYFDKKIDKNEENWARKIRYDFFKELNEKNSYQGTLIAHNLDDNLETYLLQKERDNYVSYYGLKEISEKDGTIYIRPLLSCRKKELQEYCDKNDIPYAIDKSNFDNKYKRNKLRNNLVSKLGDKEAKIILKAQKKNNKEKEKQYKKYSKFIVNNKINIDLIKKLNEEEFKILFYIYLSSFPYIKPISKELILDLYQKILNKGHLIQKIDENYYFFIEYNYFKIDKIYDFKYKFISNKSGNDLFSFFDTIKTNEIFHKYDKIIIQAVDKNDLYLYKDKYKKVSKVLVDMKLPASYRLIWPAIYNLKGELLYIPRYQEKIKVSQKSVIKFDINKLILTYQNPIKK